MNGPRARETVQKLWNASKSLQGGGVSYHEYVTELTYLLLLKMLEEVTRDGRKLEERLPPDCRWGALKKLEGEARLIRYRALLLELGTRTDIDFPLVKQVFTDAKTSLTKATALTSLITTIDAIDWYAAEEDGLGDLYEGLLERTTSERKSKAGQYFTPRALIETIIQLTKPVAGEVIQDPAAGTGGFLIAAHRAICRETDDLVQLTSEEAFWQRRSAYQGAELITGTHRLNTMNLLLHGIDEPIGCFDTLTSDAEQFEPAHLILTNPPFNKFPERVTRSDFVITAGAAKGPIPFVEHVVRGLEVGGRAAVVVPDNVLFEDNMGRELRTWLMDLCDLHTILRLPTGIFYAPGVKTNVMFFTKRAEDRIAATKAVWIYDLRAQMPSFGKTRVLTAQDFAPFVAAYGTDPDGGAPRFDEGETGRFRVFTREEISKRNDNLDISWLRDDEEVSEEGLTEPDDIAAAILGHLRAALEEIEAVADELAETAEVVE
ncbi:MAG: N-6 DNA methylase [Phenylobacterium sp.]|uniref:HsdM family class I SAM-dependent methyltransferase n=1 Tax=Phenylobacterium sp. TaxID=1871053 RepID=UPI0025FA77B1|nr:N-6 DNA methylase [Phenylobacterium sp.]MCA6243610.1 N-6 DNA methylase [Phenylobacterium sp.]MCA6245214.1 N-6 DNA methylase [Phenylobacterium sp.]MCA6254923.1 N-6 DNA methylase [Phenylobacterium sp.]